MKSSSFHHLVALSATVLVVQGMPTALPDAALEQDRISPLASSFSQSDHHVLKGSSQESSSNQHEDVQLGRRNFNWNDVRNLFNYLNLSGSFKTYTYCDLFLCPTERDFGIDSLRPLKEAADLREMRLVRGRDRAPVKLPAPNVLAKRSHDAPSDTTLEARRGSVLSGGGRISGNAFDLNFFRHWNNFWSKVKLDRCDVMISSTECLRRKLPQPRELGFYKRSETTDDVQLLEYTFGAAKSKEEITTSTNTMSDQHDARRIDFHVPDSQAVGSHIVSSAMYSNDESVVKTQAGFEAQEMLARNDHRSDEAEVSSATLSSESTEEASDSSIETTNVDESTISTEDAQLAAVREYSDSQDSAMLVSRSRPAASEA